jgi:hypothetical protein
MAEEKASLGSKMELVNETEEAQTPIRLSSPPPGM